MKKMTTRLMAALALVVLIGGHLAFAQTGGGAGSPGGANQGAMGREAPIGHRQPRADQLPSEKNLSDPNNPANKEDAGSRPQDQEHLPRLLAPAARAPRDGAPCAALMLERFMF